MAVRTLRRQLAPQGTTFRRLLEEVRYEIARQLLAGSQLSTTEIAEVAGLCQCERLHALVSALDGLATCGMASPKPNDLNVPNSFTNAEVAEVLAGFSEKRRTDYSTIQRRRALISSTGAAS